MGSGPKRFGPFVPPAKLSQMRKRAGMASCPVQKYRTASRNAHQPERFRSWRRLTERKNAERPVSVTAENAIAKRKVNGSIGPEPAVSVL